MKLLYLYTLIGVEGILLGAELVASQLTHSLIILSDAYHTLYNIISILLLVISFKMSKEKTLKNTFGWARIEVLGMLVNMTFLVALTFSLLVEGIQQLVHSSHEISQPTNFYLLFAFGACGFIFNLIYFNIVSDAILDQNKQRANSLSLRPQEKIVFNDILGLNIDSPSSSADKDSKEVSQKLISVQSDKDNVNLTASEHKNHDNVFYGIFRDLTGSILLVICGVCVLNTEGTVAHLFDPIFGIISATLFCITLYPEIKNTGLILLQTVPENINVGRLKRDILREFPIILNIHDLHVWGLTASRIIATCHIILPKQTSKSFEQFSQLLDNYFRKQGIVLATVQPEFYEPNTTPSPLQTTSLSCLMKCSKFSNTNCDSFTCCTPENNECINCSDCVELSSTDSDQFEQIIVTDNL